MTTPTAAEQAALAAEYESQTARDRGARDGVVTTPVEIVDFINRAVDEILMDRWGVTVADARVLLEDPFAGTGIFGARMLTTCPAEDVTAVAAKLQCFEIDPAAADVAEHNLRRVTYARGGTPPLDHRMVTNIDTFLIGEVDDAQPPHTP